MERFTFEGSFTRKPNSRCGFSTSILRLDRAGGVNFIKTGYPSLCPHAKIETIRNSDRWLMIQPQAYPLTRVDDLIGTCAGHRAC